VVAVGKTDIGKKRKHNEDDFFVSTIEFGPLPNICIVADGMGGHKAGSYASKTAITSLCSFVEEHHEVSLESDDDIIQFLKRAITHVNYKLYTKSESDSQYKGMGTTLTVATVVEGVLYTAHVGDSRLYTIGDRGMNQITKDHSLVQEMLSEGVISNSEAKEHPKRHVITRAVGTYEKVQVDTYSSSLEGVRYIFLCSDGLTNMLSDEEIYNIIIKDAGLEEKVDELIVFANERGGVDNITVILAIYDKAVKVC